MPHICKYYFENRNNKLLILDEYKTKKYQHLQNPEFCNDCCFYCKRTIVKKKLFISSVTIVARQGEKIAKYYTVLLLFKIII